MHCLLLSLYVKIFEFVNLINYSDYITTALLCWNFHFWISNTDIDLLSCSRSLAAFIMTGICVCATVSCVELLSKVFRGLFWKEHKWNWDLELAKLLFENSIITSSVKQSLLAPWCVLNTQGNTSLKEQKVRQAALPVAFLAEKWLKKSEFVTQIKNFHYVERSNIIIMVSEQQQITVWLIMAQEPLMERGILKVCLWCLRHCCYCILCQQLQQFVIVSMIHNNWKSWTWGYILIHNHECKMHWLCSMYP